MDTCCEKEKREENYFSKSFWFNDFIIRFNTELDVYYNYI